MKRFTAILLCFVLTGCATIHRHPKATAMIVGAGVGIGVGFALSYKKPCASSYNGIPYNGTPPCPKSCDALGDCYWPSKK